MKKLDSKGQSSDMIVSTMITLLLVGFLGIVSLTVYDSVGTSMTGSSSTAADAVIANFSDNFYDGEELASNIPLIMAAGLLIAVIIGFAMYMRG